MMKNKTFYQDKNQKLPDAILMTATEKLEQDAKGFVPAPEEVAERPISLMKMKVQSPGAMCNIGWQRRRN